MRSVIKYFVFLILPVTAVIVWLSGVLHPRLSAKEIQPQTKEIRGIKTARVEVISKSTLTYAGTIVAEERAEISTRTMGYVSYVGVKEGDYVKKGQLLIKIDPRDTKARIEAARQQLLQAKQNYNMALANYGAVKKTYERYKKLLEAQAVTQHEFDMIEAKFRAAEAQLKAAESGVKMAQENLKALSTNLSYTEVKAPFSGYVVSKMVDLGDTASPGQPLLVLEKPPYKVEVNLPERLYSKVRKGDELRVYIETLRRYVKAKIVEKEPAVNPVSRTFKVKALIKDKDVRSGFFAKIFIEEPTERTLLVPASAIYKRWDFTGVWVVKPDNTLELRFVRLGRRIGDKVEVLSGLEGNERIVVEGLERTCEGCRVGG